MILDPTLIKQDRIKSTIETPSELLKINQMLEQEEKDFKMLEKVCDEPISAKNTCWYIGLLIRKLFNKTNI